MLNKIVKWLVVPIAVLMIIWQFLPVSAGHVLYDRATAFEASLYGLNKASANLEDMQMVYFDNQNLDKPALILLHGYSSDKSVWTRFARHVSDEYRLIIPDLAGHGDTGFDNNWDYRVTTQARHINALMTYLQIDQAHIMGNSMGGFIAAHFGLAYPERATTLTLIDPAGVTAPEASDMDIMLRDHGRNPFEIDNRTQFDEFFAMTMAQPPYFPDLFLAAVAERYQARKPELRHIFEDFHANDRLDNRLHEISQPTLLLWGEKDRLLHVSSVTVWQQGITQLQTKIWPDLGHLPMLEAPGETAEVFNAFIEQTNAQ